ncbi:MAG: tyrosine-type recombinase/integrase [Verrucomicrobiota bacterium]
MNSNEKASKRISLSTQIDAFVNHCEHVRRLSPHTTKAYHLDLRQFEAFVEMETPCVEVTQIDKATIHRFVQSLSGKKAKTIRRKAACLKSFFRYLEIEDATFSNPIKQLAFRIKVEQTLPKGLSLRAVSDLLRKAHKIRADAEHRSGIERAMAIRDMALVELLFASGMRVAEVSNLRYEDIDFAENQIRVLGKGSKERILPICINGVAAALKDYEKIRPRKASEYFFLNRRKSRLSEQSIRGIIKRLARSAGLGRVTPHMLRHSVATLLLEQEFDLRYLQHFLGHSTITTTTIYAQVTANAHRKFLFAKHPRHLVRI